MTAHDPKLYAKYARRAEDAFAARDYDRQCPPDAQARFWLEQINVRLNALRASSEPQSPTAQHRMEVER